MKSAISEIVKVILKNIHTPSGYVQESDWLPRTKTFLKYHSSLGKIPSPWGFLEAPYPHNAVPQIEEIFINEHYYCDFDKKQIRIVDCGGNIGISAIWFALKIPNSKIEVYEADSTLSSIIKRNCTVAKVDNRITIVSKAVSKKSGTLFFDSDGDDRGCISNKGTVVPCIDIAEIIGDHLDLLKMDIEGAEHDCFERLAETGLLNIPNRIVAEIHLEGDDCERLERILELLRKFGFCCSLRGELATWTGPSVRPSPFRVVGNNKMFLHLYAWKKVS